MTLLENWRNLAYGDGLDDKKKEELWSGYFTIEKGIYEQILANPTEVVEGTVKELAEKYDTEVMIMTGFLDGINESLKGYENPIETMDEDTKVKIEIDPEKLYYNMVEAKATWLYELPQWDEQSCTASRRHLAQSAIHIRFIRTIRVHAEAVRNIRSAAERINNRFMNQRSTSGTQREPDVLFFMEI